MPHKEELLLEATIDKRVLHKTKNIQMSIELMHEEIGNLDKTTALIGKDVEHMKEGQDKMSEKLDKFISSLPLKFATKQELDNIKERVNGHSSYFKWVMTGFGGVIITGIAKAIGIY